MTTALRIRGSELATVPRCDVISVCVQREYADYHLHAWRDQLRPGSRVDCFDSHSKWYEGVIISGEPADGHGREASPRVRVRFLGWSPESNPGRYDEWLSRTSQRLLPPGTKIHPWRRVQVGDEIEVRDDRTVDNTEVLAVDPVRRRVQVSGQEHWAHLGNPFVLAAYATHKRM